MDYIYIDNLENFTLPSAHFQCSLKQLFAAHFIFKKKDGSYREAWGTTQKNIANAKTNGNGVSRELYKTTAYYDVEAGEWRSFRWENLVKVF